jgi:hypothetical protein
VQVRERDGHSVPAVFNSKSQVASFGRASHANGTVVHADEATSRDRSHERFEVKRINRQAAYRIDGACADMAAKRFSRRRTEAGIHRHVAGPDFVRNAQKSSGHEPAKRSLALKDGASMEAPAAHPLGVLRRLAACRRGLRATR